MGYGKNLKNELEKRKMSVAELSRRTGIAESTLRSAISRDTSLNLQNAKKISAELLIPVNKITKHTIKGENDMIEFIVKRGNMSDELLVEFQRTLDSISSMYQQKLNRLTAFMKKLREEHGSDDFSLRID